MFPIRGDCSGEGNRAFIETFYAWNETMKKFKAAIFDMDGTLLDTMYIWRHLAPAYLERNNIPAPDDLTDKLAIMGISRAVEFLIENFHLTISHEELHQEIIDILADYYRYKAVFKPGAVEFLQKLQERNIPTMVFSATPEHLLDLALTRLDAVKYFSHGLLSCNSIKLAKNKPEAFFTAAQHIGAAPDEVMIFEDAHYAASTAKNAGFAVTVMADNEEHRIQEMRELADFYIEKSFDEFPIDTFF